MRIERHDADSRPLHAGVAQELVEQPCLLGDRGRGNMTADTNQRFVDGDEHDLELRGPCEHGVTCASQPLGEELGLAGPPEAGHAQSLL